MQTVFESRTLDVPLLAAAIATSLFFTGPNVIPLLVAVTLLVAVIAAQLVARVTNIGLAIPGSTLSVVLLLYTGWLALTVLWSPVPSVSGLSFWLMASLPLAFWCGVLLPVRERHSWTVLAGAIVFVGLALAGNGVYQLWALGEEPRSVFADVNVHAGLLNLLAIPVGSYFLMTWTGSKSATALRWLFGGAFFLLVYGAMLTKGRGAILALAAGVLITFMAAARRVPARAFLVAGGLVVSAYIAADLSWSGALSERVGTLLSPSTASPERFLIWERAWQLLMSSPWLGVGLGMFPLVWPPFRHPEDGSAGYFAHNDYLQIWIEAGLPGLLLLLTALGLMTVQYVRWHRRRDIDDFSRLESSGLFGGMAAVTLHSLVVFNFYILPIVIIFGVFMARLQAVMQGDRPPPTWRLKTTGRFSIGGIRALIVLAALWSLSHLALSGMSTVLVAHGVSKAREGRLDAAVQSLTWATRLTPDADGIWLSFADLNRQLLASMGPEGRDVHDRRRQREMLYRSVEDMLLRAQSLNPFRAQTYALQAGLYRVAPDLAGEDWWRKAALAYQQALRVDPRYYSVRYSYASFLLSLGQEPAAKKLLEEGMRYTYPNADPLIPYLLLTCQMRERAGELPQALELRTRIANYVRLRGDKMTIDAATEANLAAMGLRPPRVATP